MVAKRRRISLRVRALVLDRDNHRCKWCGRGSDEVELQVDHFRALADGGTDALSNLGTLCKECNLGKADCRFEDGTAGDAVPANLEVRFRFFHDEATGGDYQQFHLYCYCQEGTSPGGVQRKFHRTWRILGSDWDRSSDKDALARRREAEEARAFVQAIRQQVAAQRKRLVFTEEGLCLVDTAEPTGRWLLNDTAGRKFASLAIPLRKLFDEMREDFRKESNEFVREFVVLPMRGVQYNSSTPIFEYYGDEHPNLAGQIHVLEGNGFVREVQRISNISRYRMSEQFVEMLLRN